MQIPMAGDEQSDRVGRHSPSTDAFVYPGQVSGEVRKEAARRERGERVPLRYWLLLMRRFLPAPKPHVRNGNREENRRYGIFESISRIYYLRNFIIELEKFHGDQSSRIDCVCVVCSGLQSFKMPFLLFLFDTPPVHSYPINFL